MNDDSVLIIEPLDRKHDRAGFYCGVSSLDRYIKKQASQDVKRRISRVFVATTEEQPGTIAGYYTLSSLSVEFKQLSERLARKLPRHPVPAALIGRLAVSQTDQGFEIGRMLLADAVKRTISVSQEIAIYAMIVDAIDERDQDFYENFGFLPLGSSEDQRLFLPLNFAQKPFY